MTNPIAVSQRARELFILLIGLDATDDFESIRNGAYDHWKKMQAVARFEAEIRADVWERAAEVADQRVQLLHDLDGPMAQMRAREANLIATAIRNQNDHDHE